MDVPVDVKGAFRTQFSWMKGYGAGVFTDDLVAAIVVTILLVPQCLAYALLAGLPPQLGIYASIFPLVAYALLGSSNYLNVGPTAVISLMTAACIATLPPEVRIASAGALALMTGGMLIVAGLLKAGFIMNFVSRPVVSAYITGAALLIILSQTKHVLGVPETSRTAFDMLYNLFAQLPNIKPLALLTGGLAILLFGFVRRLLPYLLVRWGLRAKRAKLIAHCHNRRICFDQRLF
jgi:SulP family sulfate permease